MIQTIPNPWSVWTWTRIGLIIFFVLIAVFDERVASLRWSYPLESSEWWHQPLTKVDHPDEQAVVVAYLKKQGFEAGSSTLPVWVNGGKIPEDSKTDLLATRFGTTERFDVLVRLSKPEVPREDAAFTTPRRLGNIIYYHLNCYVPWYEWQSWDARRKKLERSIRTAQWFAAKWQDDGRSFEEMAAELQRGGFDGKELLK